MIRNERRYSRNQFHWIPENDDDLLYALWQSFNMAKRAKLRTEDEHKFDAYSMDNLMRLEEDIISRRYEPSGGRAFIIFDPVIREIFAASFRDRIVHHFLYAMTGFWWDNRFIYDSYSCRDGKGTLLGAQRVQKFMEKASLAGSRPAYVLKGDLSGYFMSINREKLFSQILWGLDRQFPDHGWEYEICRFLWAEVILDDPVEKVQIVGSKAEWKSVPKNKSLFAQPSGQGIVIGNYTSQLSSNIYLDTFDRFMKFDLGFEFYGRYVDDFVVVVPEEQFEYAKLMFFQVIPEFLESMELKMHPKKIYIQPIEKGVPFLGVKVYRTMLLPGNRMKDNFYKAVEEYMNGTDSRDESIISRLGMGKNVLSKRLNQKVFESVGWEYRF